MGKTIDKRQRRTGWCWPLLWLLGLVALLGLVPRAEPAAAQALDQSGAGLRLIDQVAGASLAAAATGDVVFVGEGPRVVAYRIDEGGLPLRLGHSAVLPGVVRDLALSEDGALAVATGAGGLWLLRGDAPPRLLGGRSTRKVVTHVAWVGATLVAAEAGASLVAYGPPVGSWDVVGRMDLAGPIVELGGLAASVLLLEEDGLTVIDLEADRGMVPRAKLVLRRPLHGMAGVEGMVLVASSAGVQRVAIGGGAHPRLLDIKGDTARLLAIGGTSLWRAGSDVVRRSRAEAGWAGMRSLPAGAKTAWPIDALATTDDGRFALAAGREVQGNAFEDWTDVWNAAGLATFGSTRDGLERRALIDRPGDLRRLLPGWPGPGAGDVGGMGPQVVYGSDHRAVWGFALAPEAAQDATGAATDGSAQVYPVVPPGQIADLVDIAITGDDLFLAQDQRVYQYQLAAPPRPAVLVRTVPLLPSLVRRLLIADDVLVASLQDGMALFHLAPGAEPAQLELEPWDAQTDAAWGGFGDYDDLAFDAGLLVATRGLGTLHVIDLADPRRPTLLASPPVAAVTAGSTVPLFGTRRVLDIEGPMVVRAAGTALEIIDLADPRQPRRRALMDMPDLITGLALAEGSVDAAVMNHGLVRVDLRLPDFPDEVAVLRLPDLGVGAPVVRLGDDIVLGGGVPVNSRLGDVIGGWGLLVARMASEEGGASDRPTATPRPNGTPTPSGTSAPPAPGTPPAQGGTAMPVPGGEHRVHLPWVLRGTGR